MIAFGENAIDSLLFSNPIVEADIDFVNDWVVNPDNSEGLTVESGKITITKVKPGEWLIRSNYGFANATERNDWGTKARFKFSGLESLRGTSITYVEDHPIGDTNQMYVPSGLVITPIRPSDGLQLSHVYPWDMNIPGGKFKHVHGYSGVYVWRIYGYEYDQIEMPYNASPGYNAYSEIGFAFWTGTAPDSSGYLTLENPVIIEARRIYPLSVEGFRAFVGQNSVFAKIKTVDNTLIKWEIATREEDRFSEQIQGLNVQILKSDYQRREEAESGVETDPYAFVCHAGSSDFTRVILSPPTDLAARIAEGFPLKYWCFVYDTDTEKFWKAVIDAFASTPITDKVLGQCLFPLSNIESRFSDKGAVKLTLNAVGQYFVLDRAFDHCDFIDKVHITLQEGFLQSLLCLFRATPRLSEVLINPDGGIIPQISQWSGAFERSALVNWPGGTGLGIGNREGLSEFSEGVCDFNYAFDNCSLTRIGDYKDELAAEEDAKYWIARVAPYCVDGFYNSAITEIRYLLDMKFVVPNSNAHRVLLSSSIRIARIKNLNKGDWSLDDVTRNGCRAANFVNLDADSVNYLLENVFDLTVNPARAATDYNPITKWSVDSGSLSYRDYKEIVFYGTAKPRIKVTSTTTGTIDIIATSDTVRKFRVYSPGSGWSSVEFPITGENTIAVTIGTGENIIEVDETPSNPYRIAFSIDPSEEALSERSTVTEANLYCPSNWVDKIQTASAQIAQARGWHIYLGGTLTPY